MFESIKTKRLNTLELFKLSGSIFYRNFNSLFFITVFVYLPLSILLALFPESYIPDFGYIINVIEQQELISLEYQQEVVTFLFLTNLLSVFFIPLCMAGVTYIALSAVNDQKLLIYGIFDHSIQKWGKLIVTSIIFSAIHIVSILLFIAPGIYVGTVFAFYACVVATTNHWGMKALSESSKVVKGHFVPTLMFFIVVNIAEFTASHILLGSSSSTLMFVLTNTLVNSILVYFKVIVALKFINLNFIWENQHAKKGDF